MIRVNLVIMAVTAAILIIGVFSERYVTAHSCEEWGEFRALGQDYRCIPWDKPAAQDGDKHE